MFPEIKDQEAQLIEPMQQEVLRLTNTFWVSFYIGKQIYDKKYIVALHNELMISTWLNPVLCL